MTVTAVRIPDFDVWKPTYGGAEVQVNRAGTTSKANIYFDANMTMPAANPVFLATLDHNGEKYGKFQRPIYTNQQVTLEINSIDQSGSIRPALVTLENEDASLASSRTQRGSVARKMIERFNDTVHALDFGNLGGSSAQNTKTLNAAIGAAAGQGGGQVLLPPGKFKITTLILPQNVVLMGQHERATTIQSEEDQNVITLAGDNAGLRHMTLDGINLQPNSVGVFSKANDRTVFDAVTVKRFNTGVLCKGGSGARWRDFSLNNCITGANLSGDLDLGGGSDGAAYEFNQWSGGTVSECTINGVLLNFVDQLVRNNSIIEVGFVDNAAASALELNGARYTNLTDCYFSGNFRNLKVQDDNDTSQALLNTVISFHMINGYMNGGELNFDGLCQDVIFEKTGFTGVEWVLSIPENNILLLDSTEDSDVTIQGDGTKLQRRRDIQLGSVVGITTDATATTAWSVEVAPGALIYAEGKVIGNQRNGINRAIYHFSVGASRPGGALNYDNQLSDFVVGEVITGQKSQAQARITADTDAGATGTLTLRDISGVFENNERIVGATEGEALVNGAISLSDTALFGTLVNHFGPIETVAGWNSNFTVSSGELQLQVTGSVDMTIEWTVNVDLFAP